MSSSPIFYYTQLLHNFRLFGCTKLTIMTYVGALPMHDKGSRLSTISQPSKLLPRNHTILALHYSPIRKPIANQGKEHPDPGHHFTQPITHR